jgi:hypothetical protein
MRRNVVLRERICKDEAASYPPGEARNPPGRGNTIQGNSWRVHWMGLTGTLCTRISQ